MSCTVCRERGHNAATCGVPPPPPRVASTWRGGPIPGPTTIEARRRLALRGVVSSPELSGLPQVTRVLGRMVRRGEIVRVARSNLFAVPDVAAKLVAVLAAAKSATR